jgi:2-oxoisovalerate dehydrogenase E1 component beta subunit
MSTPIPRVVDVAVKTVVQAVHDTLFEEMKRDDRVMVLGEDVGARGGVFRATRGFLDEFGAERVIDTPLDECLIAGVAIGMALDDLRPIAEMQFADFIFPAFNQIVSEAARIRYRSNGDFGVPLVIRAPYGGGVHGALYHSQSVEAFFAHVPGLKVVAPSTPADVKGMLVEAVEDPDPVLFLEHKKTYRLVKGEVPDERYRVRFGVAEVRREGTDLTCVSYGLLHHYALEAAERLAGGGIEVEVIDLRSIYPLDMDTVLSSVAKTNKVMIAYEDTKFLGVGAEVAAQIAENALFELDGPIVRVGGPHIPAMPYSPALEHWYLPDVERLEQEMRKLAEY